MRQVSARWRASVGGVVRWQTSVEVSNNGGQTWVPCRLLSGSVTADATQQVRWSADLTVDQIELGEAGINPYSSQLRIRHGMAGELLPMGRLKVTAADHASGQPGAVHVQGSSFELYVQRARFLTPRTIYKAAASSTLLALIREVLPSAQVSWRDGVDDQTLPQMVADRDRWGVIDGGPDDKSIAKALGAIVYAGPSGEWVVAPVPTISDPVAWEAAEGPGGVLLSHSEALDDSQVRNVVVASGSSTSVDAATFPPGIAMDLDALSPTNAQRPIGQGGFGQVPRFYASPLLTSTVQAQRTAQALLAPTLGLRQQIGFTQLHDPSLEPGDVGIVHTKWGPRRAILDAVSYDLSGGPLTASTRTTATRLGGQVWDAPVDAGDADA